MAPDVPDDHDPTISLGASSPKVSHLTPTSVATHDTVPVSQSEHTIATEFFALLRDLDSLQKVASQFFEAAQFPCLRLIELYNDTLSEVCSLKSTLRLEMKVREAAETTCADLEKEKQRLLANQLARYAQTVQQLDYASKYATTFQSLEEIKRKLASLEKVQEMKIVSLITSQATNEEDLRRQITGLRKEVAAKESATSCLEKQLSQTITPDFFKLKMQETEQQLHEKYLIDLAELRKALTSEEMNNQKLQTDLKEAQQSLISWKVKYDDQLKDMSANRHADMFKQKVMKLRKDNDMLKRQIQNFEMSN